MNGWWWLPVGVGGWLVVGTAVALAAGRFLGHCSRERDAVYEEAFRENPLRPGDEDC